MIGKRAHGIDISYYQEELKTPPQNSAEIDFVVLKASQANREDGAFERLYLAARDFPLRGAYHYFITQRSRTSELLADMVASAKKVKGGKVQGVKANTAKGGKFKGPEARVLYRGEWIFVPKARVRTSVVDSPKWQEQADFFLSKVAGKDISFFALDVERGPDPETHIGYEHNIFTADDVRNIKTWINYVKDKTGKPVLLYTNADVYISELLTHGGQILADLDLWLAGYPHAPNRDEQDPLQFFKLPANNWRFWQYSADKNGEGAVYGVKSPDIDLNVFNGTRDELFAWLGLEADRAFRTVPIEGTGAGAVDRSAVEGKSATESGTEEKRAPDATTEHSFTVVVTETKALIQYIKNRDKAGKPIMMPREPRIRLPKGTQINVSATHKASDKDAGDGNVHGTGNILYYCVTDCPFDREAEGLYVRQADVSRV